MRLIDSHCHLDVTEFSASLPDVLARAAQVDVTAFVVPAIGYSSWAHLAELAKAYPCIKPAYGMHPMFLAEHRDAHLHALPNWLARPECVAVGECGLDFFVPDLDVDLQESIFITHLQLAKQFNKPLIIHARKSTERVIQLLKQHGALRGVIHSYSGSLEQATQLINMGFLLGIAGPITYPRSNRIRTLVQEIGLEHLLLETDSPDQPLFGEQGRRNEPAHLPKVAQAVAEVKGVAVAEVARQTTANAMRLFRFSP